MPKKCSSMAASSCSALRNSRKGAAWDSATTATMTMTSMTTWDNVAVMETVADTAEDTGTVMAAARWASAAECPEQDAIQDTVSLTRRDGGFPVPANKKTMNRTKEPLDIYDDRPKELTAYLRHNGWHFNKKLCDFAVSLMRRMNPATGKSEKIEPMTKDKVDELLAKNGVRVENNTLYDYVYVANQAKADCFKSSIADEPHLALYVKDIIDDYDAPEGMVMCMWYAKMTRAGEPVEWDEML